MNSFLHCSLLSVGTDENIKETQYDYKNYVTKEQVLQVYPSAEIKSLRKETSTREVIMKVTATIIYK